MGIDSSDLKTHEELAGNQYIVNKTIPESAIDMGLSVRWSSVNLDATSPEQSGEYYAWGELEAKPSLYYDWQNYRWSIPYVIGQHTYFASDPNKQYYLSKYNDRTYDGKVLKTTLAIIDDVANKKLGSEWRIPTRAEFGELISMCKWEWTELNGVKGYMVTSRINGNSIFLPAIGTISHKEDPKDWGAVAGFWSCSYNAEDPTRAYCLYFRHEDGMYSISLKGNVFRCEGLAIRPVWGERVIFESPIDLLKSIYPNSTNNDTDWRHYSTRRLIEYAEDEYPGKNIVYGCDGEYYGSAMPNPKFIELDSEKNLFRIEWIYSGETKNIEKSIFVQLVKENGEWRIDNIGDTNNSYFDYSKPPINPKTRERSYSTGPAAVDMGFSVKWGSFNVGATQPYEYGDYFAWGETFVKSDYSESTYRWMVTEKGYPFSKDVFLKYNTYLEVDNKSKLDLSDDVAHIKYGGKWRMPTMHEFIELYKADWEWTTQNGVNGYLLTSNTTGNSIFLPAAGALFGEKWNSLAGEKGLYWSSEYQDGNPYPPMELSFTKYNTMCSSSRINRCSGLSIRPVWDDNLIASNDIFFSSPESDALVFLNTIYPNSIANGIDWQSYATDRFVRYAAEECDYDPVYQTQDAYSHGDYPHPKFTKVYGKEDMYKVEWMVEYDNEEIKRSVILVLTKESWEWKIDNIWEGDRLLFDYSKPPEPWYDDLG